MLTESLVGVMAMIAAATLDPGVYFAMNVGAGDARADGRSGVAGDRAWGFIVTPQQLDALARQMGEATLLSRTGGAPSLAVGMAQHPRRRVQRAAGLALWYHFAIMFEALFILTTIDAGTRVGPLHAAGAARPRLAAARPHVLVSEHPGLDRRSS